MQEVTVKIPQLDNLIEEIKNLRKTIKNMNNMIDELISKRFDEDPALRVKQV